MAKGTRTTSISLSPEDDELFEQAMQNDGMDQLTLWMKAICRMYANGHLVRGANLDDIAKALDKITKQMASITTKLESLEARMPATHQDLES